MSSEGTTTKTLRKDYSPQTLRNIVLAAQGKVKADLIVTNADLVDVVVGDIREKVNIAIWNNYVVRVGYFDVSKYRGPNTIIMDVKDAEMVTPGFIEPHVHIESSLLTVQEFSRAALIHGTTTVAADPHEIANVLGVDGIKMFIEESRHVPLRVFFYVPSCVPPTKAGLDTVGSTITANDTEELMKEEEVIGLGEVMDFLSVINADEEIMRKISCAKLAGKVVDGHAPQLPEDMLVPYAASGIEGDHESVFITEALMKLRNGMHVLVREGSAWKDLDELSKILTYMRINTRYLVFASDDIEVTDLVDEGHLDRILRRAVSLGIDPITAVQMATINAAEYLKLPEIGAVTPGRFADIVVLKNFRQFEVRDVIVNGKVVVHNGRYMVSSTRRYRFPGKAYKTMNIGRRIQAEDLAIKAPIRKGKVKFQAIRAVPGKAITKKEIIEANVNEGIIELPAGDTAYIATIERHHATGNIGKGIVVGLGLKKGALAQTIAHDVHNVVVVGKTLDEMAKAVNELVRMGGGMVAVLNGAVIGSVRLPIAGLMSDKPFEEVYEELEAYRKALMAMGMNYHECFMTIALLSLSVIPEVRVTDKGVVDVLAGKIINPIMEVRAEE